MTTRTRGNTTTELAWENILLSSQRFEGPVATTETDPHLGYVSLESTSRVSTTVPVEVCDNPFVSHEWRLVRAPDAVVPVPYVAPSVSTNVSSNPDDDDVDVLAPPPPTPPAPVVFDEAVSPDWRRDAARGAPVGGVSKLTITPDGPGTYVFRVTTVGSCVGQSATSDVTLHVRCNEPPVPEATVTTTADSLLDLELLPPYAAPPPRAAAASSAAAAPTSVPSAVGGHPRASESAADSSGDDPRPADAVPRDEPVGEGSSVLQEDHARRVGEFGSERGSTVDGRRHLHACVVPGRHTPKLHPRARDVRRSARVVQTGWIRGGASARSRGFVRVRPRDVRRMRAIDAANVPRGRDVGRDVRDRERRAVRVVLRAAGRRRVFRRRRRVCEITSASVDASSTGGGGRGGGVGGAENRRGTRGDDRGVRRRRTAHAREGGARATRDGGVARGETIGRLRRRVQRRQSRRRRGGGGEDVRKRRRRRREETRRHEATRHRATRRGPLRPLRPLHHPSTATTSERSRASRDGAQRRSRDARAARVGDGDARRRYFRRGGGRGDAISSPRVPPRARSRRGDVGVVVPRSRGVAGCPPSRAPRR